MGVLVGVLIGSGVLFGMTAVVVDVGAIYAERAQLQSGADAGALAVAKGCATGTADCSDSTDPEGPAGRYANGNSRDGASAAALVCGSDAEGILSPCPPSSGGNTDCPDAPAEDVEYVDVHTSTKTLDGQTLLPPSFAQVLSGNDSPDGVTVGACARASWGAPQSTTTVAMTISLCEWWVATGGTPNGPAAEPDYAPEPPYPPDPDPAYDRVLKLHTTKTDTDCPGGEAGSDGPGMFGWVDDPDGDCSVDVEDGEYDADTGVSAGKSCQEVLEDAYTNRKPISIPIYRATDEETGANGTYYLEGFAAFIVTGYRLPGFTASDWLNPANDCKGSDKCINGFFTRDLTSDPGTIGGPDMGLTTINLTG